MFSPPSHQTPKNPLEKKLPILGLTGGIATGKSTAVQLFQALAPSCVIFDADHCVAEFYKTEQMAEAIEKQFGSDYIQPEGVNKVKLRQLIFSQKTAKKQLEDLIHPHVYKECLDLLKKVKQTSAAECFIADVPLLFEGRFNFGQDQNLVIAVSKNTQRERLKKRNGFNDATIDAILQSQLPLDQKIALADTVFWNEGKPTILKIQIQRFLDDLKSNKDTTIH